MLRLKVVETIMNCQVISKSLIDVRLENYLLL